MKKQSKIVAIISVLVILMSLIIVPTSAASYPLIMDNHFRYSVVENDTVVLSFTIFPEYKNERYHIELYDSYGSLVAEVSDSYYNTSSMPRDLDITVNAADLELSPGEYTIKYYMEFYTFSAWHFAPNTYKSYLTVVANTCNGNHSFDAGDVIIEATCSKEGNTKYTCSRCSYFKYVETTGDHTWDDGEVTTPTTCTTNGVKTYTCTSCKETKTETITARHNWNSGTVTLKETCTTAGTMLYTCIDCNVTKTETISATGHKWDNGKIVSEATYLKEGSKEYKCTVCEDVRTDTIAKKSFKDVAKSKWFNQYVAYVAEYGIFTGTGNNNFSPNNNITRAQFVQVLSNLVGVDTSNRNVTTEFSDVPKGKWFTAAVKWASENGVVNGMGKGKFAPNANVTREQMCVMLVNFAKFQNITLNSVEAKENFADDAKISKWAKDAVYSCQMADIVNGKGKGNFDPKGTGTRAEASVMFTKFHKDYMTK